MHDTMTDGEFFWWAAQVFTAIIVITTVAVVHLDNRRRKGKNVHLSRTPD